MKVLYCVRGLTVSYTLLPSFYVFFYSFMMYSEVAASNKVQTQHNSNKHYILEMETKLFFM